MDTEQSGDEKCSQEIGRSPLSVRDYQDEYSVDRLSDDSGDLPSFVSTPTLISSSAAKGKTTAFRRGDFAWAKHKEIWWPAVVKNVYKARRCATIVWTDEEEEHRQKNLTKGFKVGFQSLRPWSCPDRKSFLLEGERKHGLRFENAVGMLENFLMKKAKGEIALDIFEYLSTIHGTMYSLLDFTEGEEREDGRRKDVEKKTFRDNRLFDAAEEDANYSPDIKKIKMTNVDRNCNSRTSIFMPSVGSTVNDLDVDDDDQNGVNDGESAKDCCNNFTRARRNLRKDLMEEGGEDRNGASSSRIESIANFIASDECRQRLFDIHENKEKSFLKVFYEHRPNNLKEAKLNNFGPLSLDEDVDGVMETLKKYFRQFSKKRTLNVSDCQFVMDVMLPEALSHSLHVLEGKSLNESLREVWFGSAK